jgi:hypothetical protein
MRSQVNGNVGPTKTETQRTVTLIVPVLEMLKVLPAFQHNEGIMSEVPGLVFPSRLGGYRYASMLLKPLARCAAKAGIRKNITAHTMRRTCNNLVRQAPCDIAARAMVGHATAEMTEHHSDVTLPEERLTNSRMKDFYDPTTLAQLFDFDGALVAQALRATFERRGPPLPASLPMALTPEFSADAQKNTQWRAFTRKARVSDAGELAGAMAAVGAFIWEPLRAAAAGLPWQRQWQRGGPWNA